MATSLTCVEARSVFRDILSHQQLCPDGCVLTASIADALLAPSDGPREVVACWWIASKFEDVVPLDVESLVFRFLPLHVPRYTMVEVERKVLARVGWIVPYKTMVRAIYELSDVAVLPLVCDYCYAFLDSGMLARHHEILAEEWVNTIGSSEIPWLDKELKERCDSRIHERLVKARDARSRPVFTCEKTQKRKRSPTSDNFIDLTIDTPSIPQAPKKSRVVIDLCSPA